MPGFFIKTVHFGNFRCAVNHFAIFLGVEGGIPRLTDKISGYLLNVSSVRSADYLENLAAEIQQTGAIAKGFPTDITRPQAVVDSFTQIREQLGKVDIMVNHAGNASWGDFSGLTPDDVERSWRICTYGSFLCCQQAVADMPSSGGGAILFTGATSGL